MTVTAVLPKRILLLASAMAPAPMAVALVKAIPRGTLARAPIAVLLLPVVLPRSAAIPLAVFPSPVVLKASAMTPLAVLLLPVVLLVSAWLPLAVFASPVVLKPSAANPLAVARRRSEE